MAENQGTEFGRLLREYRHRANLTKKEFADLAGLGDNTLDNIERGATRNLRRDTLYEIRKALMSLGFSDSDIDRLYAAARATRTPIISRATTTSPDDVGRTAAAETSLAIDRQAATIVPEAKYAHGTTITWLHLSDWHQGGDDFNRRVVRDALLQDIRNRQKIDERLAHLDFVIFSGDVAFSGKAEEYQSATKELLDPLMAAVGLSPSELFIVPGNHDIDRDRFDLLPARLQQQDSLSNETEVQTWLVNDDKRRRLLDPFSAYEKFIAECTGQDDPLYGSIRVHEKAGIRIALVGLNSSWMCGRPGTGGTYNDYGHLLVGEPQVYDALRKVEDAHLRIAVLHHPFEWLAEFDRDRVEDRLEEACHFILHGHLHKPKIRVTHVPGRDYIVIPAGASYARRVAEHPRYTNSYNFVCLELRTGTGTIYFRRWDDTQNSWVVDDSTASGGTYVFPLSMGLQKRLTTVPVQVQQQPSTQVQPNDFGAQQKLSMSTNHPHNFGDLLRRYRHDAGLTMLELAERSNVSLSYINAIERGVRRPSRNVAQALAAALHVRDNDLELFVRLARSPMRDSSLQVPSIPKSAPQKDSLDIFMCHASDDKPAVRDLYQRLRADGMNPWLDEEDLLPGQDWKDEISKAMRTIDVVLVCLSHKAVTKAGYVQKEIKDALDIADEQPPGSIFLIPIRLEECTVPERLRRWQWVNLFQDGGYERLLRALKQMAQLGRQEQP